MRTHSRARSFGPTAAVVAALVLGTLSGAGSAAAATSITVSSTSTSRVAPNTTGALAGLSVANTGGATVQVTLATDVGSVALPSHANLTLAYANHWSGDPSITFTGSEADAQTALNAATLSTGNTAGQTAHVSVTASPADSTRVYLAPNQHYYEYVASSNITWTAADTAAKAKTFQGQRGYLATIPNTTVNDFISSKIQGAVNVWFGAQAYVGDVPNYARVWRWTKGSDESPLQGQTISNCNSNNSQQTCSFTDNTGLYNSWAPGEPNNYNGEYYAVTNWQGSVGKWNDLNNNPGGIAGYVVEYGDQAVGSTGFNQTVTASANVLVADVPGAPTAVSAARGNGSASVSFTAPASNGGSAITGYTVTSAPGGKTATCAGSPCTVAGLDNGTSYTFTVVASNAIGDSSPSAASNAVTPATVPGAPTGVIATRGNGSVSVSFTAPASNGGSAITSYTVTSAPGGKTATCAGSPCTVAGLDNGTGYTFSVVATNAIGSGAASSASSAVTPATVPGAPTSVTATRGNGSAAVAFTAPASNGGSPITSYTVTSAPGGKTATCAGSPCTVTGLDNGTSYTFTVVATNDVGDSNPSAASNAVTPATVPGAPTAVSATRGNGSASISFTAPASNGGSAITSYTVTSAPGGKTATCAGSPCTVAGLDNGTSYTFAVVATNSVGDSNPSAASNAVTPATKPDAPTDVVATRGNGSASISFTPPASNGSPITGYTVTAAPGGKTVTCDGLSACIVAGLDNGTSYTFAVVATNDVGDSTPSAASAAVTPATVPGAPGITSVVSNAGSLTVTFTAPTADGSDAITGYEYSVDGVHWASLTTTGSGPYTGTIAGLSNGTSYPVRVRAVNSVGSGPASAPVSATPATTPAAATNVASSVRDGQVTVTWKAPTDNGGSAITGYTVTAQPGGITCRTTGATSCTFPALPPGKSYRFSVVATNANGSSTATGVGTGAHSAPSAPTRVSGLPSAPRSLRVTTGDRTLNLRWAKPADDGGARITHYLVSLDGGRHWQQVDSTHLTVEGVPNGVAFRVLVRATNANGAGARSATVRTATRQWFHDPISPKARAKQRSVPAKPWSYGGKPVATRNTARSANGSPALPVGALHGRQLQRGQAAGLGAGTVFRFDSAVLTAAGKRQVRALAASLRYVDGIVCEGFSDYGGKTAHEAQLSLQRAKTVCAALRADGVEVSSSVKGYGASRPVVIGGTPADRGANRRVVVLVTR